MSPRSGNEIAPVACSFCRKSSNDVRAMVAGEHDVAICNECIDVCVDIVADRHAPGRWLFDSEESDAEPPDLIPFTCPACGHHWKMARASRNE